MTEFRLPKEEWKKLDELLGKHGFGGYYDLVESLKDVGSRLGIGYTGIDLYPEGDNQSISLPQMVSYLRDWSLILSRSEDFKKLAEKIAEEIYIEKGSN